MSVANHTSQQPPIISVQSLDAPANPLNNEGASLKHKIDISIETPFIKIVHECIVKSKY